MTNQELKDKAAEAINELFADASVSQEETQANMEQVIDDIVGLVDTLP